MAAGCEDTAVNASTEPSGGNSPVAVILLAAGTSSRMGGSDKLWVDLGGEPLVARSLRTLGSLPGVAVLAIVAPAARHDALRAITATLPESSSLTVRFVEGGPRRQESVAAGLAAVPAAAWVLIHDAARPLVSAELATRVLAAARASGAALPGVPIADTVKRVTGTGEPGIDRVAARPSWPPCGRSIGWRPPSTGHRCVLHRPHRRSRRACSVVPTRSPRASM